MPGDLLTINGTVFGNYYRNQYLCNTDESLIGNQPVVLMSFYSDAHISTYLTLFKQGKKDTFGNISELEEWMSFIMTVNLFYY